MPAHLLYLVVCQLRAAYEATWSTTRRRAYIAALQAQTRALAWREIGRHNRTRPDVITPATDG